MDVLVNVEFFTDTKT